MAPLEVEANSQQDKDQRTMEAQSERLNISQSNGVATILPADTYSQEKKDGKTLSILPSGGTKHIGNGIPFERSSPFNVDNHPDIYIEIPNKLAVNLPYITRQLNRKTWGNYLRR